MNSSYSAEGSCSRRQEDDHFERSETVKEEDEVDRGEADP